MLVLSLLWPAAHAVAGFGAESLSMSSGVRHRLTLSSIFYLLKKSSKYGYAPQSANPFSLGRKPIYALHPHPSRYNFETTLY
ncbi:hypothetical protein JAAARDRAFT_42232 [Jaapia argillacea MUCL 33604]|uniref:Uncharacterized protein n=1 Tax=Jaapia argillacea MUCL 33604 TaxID=933084 RepID=A0A067P607_9AGAM|nr:hypothetical protein JAAARDRAFT_42232 [Jaapia argillacea MUCL 33604]